VNGHLSRRIVANALKRLLKARRAAYAFCYLAPSGVYRTDKSPCRRCALTAPFHPYRINSAVYFCCTLLGVASTRCYLALCPSVLGLSSCNACDHFAASVLFKVLSSSRRFHILHICLPLCLLARRMGMTYYIRRIVYRLQALPWAECCAF